VQGWLEAAGEALDPEALRAAVDETFEVSVPGGPEARTYGAAPAGDGDPAAYVYEWDDERGVLVRSDD
jgi:hypothetical protein